MSSLRELKAGPSAEQQTAAQLKRQQLIADLGTAHMLSALTPQQNTRNETLPRLMSCRPVSFFKANTETRHYIDRSALN